MNNIVKMNADQTELTMSSLELRGMINEIRKEYGEPPVRNDDFVKRVENELEGELPTAKLSQSSKGGLPSKSYDLTIEQCTLVGMRESKGVRRQVLSKLKELQASKLLTTDSGIATKASPIEQAGTTLKVMMSAAELFGLEGNPAKISANVATRKVTGIDFMDMLQIELKSENNVKYLTPTQIGQGLEAPASARKVNTIISELGYQTKVGKEWVPTDEGKKLAQILDTGKKYHDGTMVQQMKWSSELIDIINRMN